MSDPFILCDGLVKIYKVADLEMVALREPCYKLTALDPRMPDLVVGRVGVMARVVEGGIVRVGDEVVVVLGGATE